MFNKLWAKKRVPTGELSYGPSLKAVQIEIIPAEEKLSARDTFSSYAFGGNEYDDEDNNVEITQDNDGEVENVKEIKVKEEVDVKQTKISNTFKPVIKSDDDDDDEVEVKPTKKNIKTSKETKKIVVKSDSSDDEVISKQKKVMEKAKNTGNKTTKASAQAIVKPESSGDDNSTDLASDSSDGEKSK